MTAKSLLLALIIALGAQVAASAQVIGYLTSTSCNTSNSNFGSFNQGLKEAGVSNPNIIYKCADNDLSKLPELVQELADTPVSVIFTSAIQATLAAKAHSTKIPIIFATANDPVKFRIVDSLARPGGRMTGVTWLTAQLSAKRLELLLRTIPHHIKIGVLANPDNANFQQNLEEIKNAASQGGATVFLANAETPARITKAVQEIIDAKCDAIFVQNDPLFLDRKDELIAAINTAKIPSIFPSLDYVRAGGLMSYGASITDAHRLGGLYVAKVIRGEDPALMPVLQPTSFSTAINLLTARNIGLVIPQEIQVLADEVIE